MTCALLGAAIPHQDCSDIGYKKENSIQQTPGVVWKYLKLSPRVTISLATHLEGKHKTWFGFIPFQGQSHFRTCPGPKGYEFYG